MEGCTDARMDGAWISTRNVDPSNQTQDLMPQKLSLTSQHQSCDT